METSETAHGATTGCTQVQCLLSKHSRMWSTGFSCSTFNNLTRTQSYRKSLHRRRRWLWGNSVADTHSKHKLKSITWGLGLYHSGAGAGQAAATAASN